MTNQSPGSGTVEISLRLFHDGQPIDAGELQLNLGRTPSASWTIGEDRVTPISRRPLGGTRRNSYWCADLVAEQAAGKDALEAALRSALDELESSRGWVRAFVAGGGRVELYAWLRGWSPTGVLVPAALSLALAALPADLALEFI
jgi:hypothetical protein